jgi:hypothetical protein
MASRVTDRVIPYESRNVAQPSGTAVMGKHPVCQAEPILLRG